MEVEWDPGKAATNLAKHGVSFEEAASVFGDRLATTVLDPDHSLTEERFLTTGLSMAGRVLVVWHAERGELTRLIGAREANRSERRIYETGE